MTSIKLHSHIGPDGMLKLEVPVGMAETDVEIVVIFQPVKPASPTAKQAPEELGWPPGFFEQTYGALKDEPMVREPQGEYEVRNELK